MGTRETATAVDDAVLAPARGRPGRKLDRSRDAVILDATLAVLGEHGYDRMTIDMVAARADMARATVYRRWPTKADLVLDAVNQISRGDVDENATLPDTGTLREDLAAMIQPFDDDQQQVRIQAIAGLLALARTDDRLAEAATSAGIGPWIELNRTLIQRAVDRGEFPPPANLDLLAELIPTMCVSRAVQQLPITAEFSLALIDTVLIPALRGGSRTVPKPPGSRPRGHDSAAPNHR